ncbi:MAG: class I SAM-dependent methyltransferase [Phycisphaerales bacterium]
MNPHAAPSPAAAAARLTACPNCLGGAPLDRIYEIEGIPAHTCLLMPTRQEALDFPLGGLDLAFCNACGFVFNAAFQEGLLRYGEQYEETQGFSPTFNAFARQLAGALVDRYALRGKRVLEIGCGKGEFVALMCELGMAGGIGIDPAYIPGRLTQPGADRVEFIRDFYGPKYTHLHADLVLCRHTLEHIAPTLEFMRMVRASIGDRPETLVVFELPDVVRVLREGAFWDVYHEHCTYFSPGSLARVFRLAGFDVTDLWEEYDGQYLLIAARPAPAGRPGSGGPLPLEEPPAQLRPAAVGFGPRVAAVVDRWRAWLAEGARKKKRTVVWGSGSKGVSFLMTVKAHDAVDCVVDVNPHKRGRFMPGSGHEIVGPQDLRDRAPERVVVMNPIYIPEITRDLEKMGMRPEVVAV